MALPCVALNGRPWLVAYLCAFVFVQSMVIIGLESAVVTSLERRYGFSSFQAGIVVSFYDVMVLLAVLPLSYLGRRNKPRALGVGLAIFAVGCAVFTLPQFTTARYSPPSGAECGVVEDGTTAPFLMLLLAQGVMGLGACTLFTLGPALLDECQDDKNSVPLYLGAFYAVGAVGPALGFVLGGMSLGWWVDPGGDSAGLMAGDSNWVGAWWVFFVVAAIMAAVACVPLLLVAPPTPSGAPTRDDGYALHRHGNSGQLRPPSPDTDALWPRDAPPRPAVHTQARGLKSPLVEGPGDGAQHGAPASPKRGAPSPPKRVAPSSPKPTRVTPAGAAQSTDGESDAAGASDSGIVHHVKVVFTTPAIVFGAFGQAAEALVVSAGAAFFPKLLEVQYNLTAGLASMLAGSVVVSCAAGGMLCGGWLMKKLECTPQQVADWTYRIAFVAFLTTAIFFIGCGAAPLAGVTAAYRDSGTTIALNSACNQQGTYYGGGSSGVAGQPAPCPHVYTPVCGGNGQTFINACYAGCFGADESDAATSYGACLCAGVGAANGTVVADACDGGCWGGTLPLFMLGLGALLFSTFMNNAPASTVILRSVPEELRSVAMTAPFATGKIFGVIPGPVILGSLLDATCRFETRNCHSSFCAVYNLADFRTTFLLWAAGAKALSALFFYLSARTFTAAPGEEDSEPTSGALEGGVAAGRGRDGDAGSPTARARARAGRPRRRSAEAAALELVEVAQPR